LTAETRGFAARAEPTAECPWCGAVCTQLLDEVNHRPRRSAYKCSRCKQRTLPCKGKAHRAGALADELEQLREELGTLPAGLATAVQRLREELGTPVDREDAAHDELLARLRARVVPGADDDGSAWARIGFEDEGPVAGFGATGVLGLRAMAFTAGAVDGPCRGRN
jgi:hypothetical protein